MPKEKIQPITDSTVKAFLSWADKKGYILTKYAGLKVDCRYLGIVYEDEVKQFLIDMQEAMFVRDKPLFHT